MPSLILYTLDHAFVLNVLLSVIVINNKIAINAIHGKLNPRTKKRHKRILSSFEIHDLELFALQSICSFEFIAVTKYCKLPDGLKTIVRAQNRFNFFYKICRMKIASENQTKYLNSRFCGDIRAKWMECRFVSTSMWSVFDAIF